MFCPLFGLDIPSVFAGGHELGFEDVNEVIVEREKHLIEGIGLMDEVRIRRMREDDIRDVKSIMFQLPSFLELSSNMFVLSKSVIVEDKHQFEVSEIIQSIVLAFRLFREGYISGPYVFYVPISTDRRFPSVTFSYSGGRRREHWGGGYTLFYEEIQELRELDRSILQDE